MDSRVARTRKHGFSLVELSIVLVILGLLVGGVLSGQSLIRAAELRSVLADYSKYTTATHTFRDKYFALPGDMTNATSFWGTLGGTGSDFACQNHAPNGIATCNGNGDGAIGFPWVNCTVPAGTPVNAMVTGEAEMTRFWQHLSNAGIIEGSYTGYPNASAASLYSPVLTSSSAPVSKIGTAYWTPAGTPYGAPCAGTTNIFATQGANQFTVYDNNSLWVAQAAPAPVFKPEEAWNLDTKLDDSKPGTGRVTSLKTSCTTASGVAPPGDATAQYQLSTTTKVCGLWFSS